MINYYLVDSENVSDSWLELLDSIGSEDKILVFYTDKSPNMAMNSVVKLKQSSVIPSFFFCSNGTDNALDFQLSTYLGYLICNHPDDTFCIISKDKGYDAVISFWTNEGYKVVRSGLTNEMKVVAETLCVTDDDNTDPVNEINAISDYLAEVDTLMSCIGRSELSKLHNVLIAIYGKEFGAEIYNIVKKSTYEIPKVNWQKKTKFYKFLHILYDHSGYSIGNDFLKLIYSHKDDLQKVSNDFTSKYGKTNGPKYYKIYKQQSEFIKKNF